MSPRELHETVTDEQIGLLLDAGLITMGTYLAATGRGFAAPDQPAWRLYLETARALVSLAAAREFGAGAHHGGADSRGLGSGGRIDDDQVVSTTTRPNNRG